ncbi:MAG TPA: flagellar biosynthetic protein FliO [Solimonas sp.]
MSASASAAAATTAAHSTAAATPSLAGGAVEMIVSLMLVLGVLFALAWLLKRVQMARGSRAGALRIHAGLTLGGREKVVWIEAGGRHFLLGVTAQAVNLLHAYDDAPELPEAEPLPPLASAFAEKLKEALGRKPS